jgi:hypothetical protein
MKLSAALARALQDHYWSRYLVVPVYLAASLVLTWPLAESFGSHLPAVGYPYDALLQVFLLGWGWHGLTTNPLEVFNAPIFHPEIRTLTYMDHMLGEAVLAGPIIGIFGLGAGYNFLILFSFVASGYFVYRLARLYGISRSGSCAAGFFFAFCPYRFSHLGCLNQLQTQFIPLGIFFAVRFLRAGGTRDGVWLALTVAVQSYFGWYSTFHLLVAVAVLFAWEAVREPGRWRQLPWRQTALLASTSAVLAAPSALPYVLQKLAMPEFDRPLSETIRCSADLLDYVRVNSDNILAQLVPPLGHWAGFFPGVMATGLAAVGIGAGYRTQRKASRSQVLNTRATFLKRARTAFGRSGEMGYFLLLALSGLVLSLGPLLHVAGHRLWIPLPYALFYYVVPGFSSMRTPGRFAVLVALAAAVVAGKGIDALRQRLPRAGVAVPACTLLAAGALAWCPSLPFVQCPDRASMPAVYGWLAAQPDSSPFLELPVPAQAWNEGTKDVLRQACILYHHKPRLDGASGFTSNRYVAFRQEMQEFPSAEAIRRAYEMGARRLIVHYGDYAPALQEGMRHDVERSRVLRRLAAFGQDVVYGIEEPEEE